MGTRGDSLSNRGIRLFFGSQNVGLEGGPLAAILFIIILREPNEKSQPRLREF